MVIYTWKIVSPKSFIFHQQTRSVGEHYLYNGRNYELNNPLNNNDSAAIQRYYGNNVSWQGATSSCDICMLQVDFIPIEHQNVNPRLHYKNTTDTLPSANPTNASYNPFPSKYSTYKPYNYRLYYRKYMKYLIYNIKQDPPIIIQI